MANAPPLAQMRAQFNSLLDAGWGEPTVISRLSGSTDSAGHRQGNFATIGTEQIWIQAITGHSSVDVKNLDAETTHLAYQKVSGTPLLPKDQLLPSGATYKFDVISSEIFETHRMSQVKQDLRT